MKPIKIAAFFDFDNTLLADDSAKIGVKYLVKKKEISLRKALWLWLLSRLYARDLLTVQQMCDATITLYRGKRLERFIAGSTDFYVNELKPRLAPRILDRLEEHRRQGHVLVLLSASLDYVLHDAFKDLRFDHLLCSRLEENAEGVLTGRIDGPLCASETKARYAQRLADEMGIDLSQSHAYGDHHSDIPILSLVGNPVAVAPTKALRAHAEERSWPIIGHF